MVRPQYSTIRTNLVKAELGRVGTIRARDSLLVTELEGAVLSVINGLGSCTPYQVRQNFLASRSREWSGSAGAVYPAVRRLEARGLLRAQETEDARSSVRFSLSASGRRAFDGWIKDVERASGSGLDPFRCRADHWDLLPAAGRRALLQALKRSLERRLAMLDALSEQPDTAERRALALEVELHKTRVRWLDGQLRRLSPRRA